MRVRMLTTAAGPDGIYRPGEIWAVNTDTGMSMVAGGYATAIDPVSTKKAVLQAPETAIAPPAPNQRKGPQHD